MKVNAPSTAHSGGGFEGEGGGGNGATPGGYGGNEGGDGGEGGGEGGGGAGHIETVPETPVRVVGQEQTVPAYGETRTLPAPPALPLMVDDEMVTVPLWTWTPPPDPPQPPLQVAVLPVMVHDDKASVPPSMETPPPKVAVLPLMVDDEIITVLPLWTKTPPPLPKTALPVIVEDVIMTVPEKTETPPPDDHPATVLPPVMPSPMSCTTPDEPGLMFSTRACCPAFRVTVAPGAASTITLLVMLSSALR